MAYDYFPAYVSVGERRAKAARKLKQLKEKNPNIQPVVIQGTKLAKNWWGISWNHNLERYADYSNRIERGRSYLRHGSVLDLKIEEGRVEAMVQGTRSKPYEVTIRIAGLADHHWKKIVQTCRGKLTSLQQILAGEFPREMADVFMAQGEGLFPTPDEIEFECSCPDWAYMCKHVAATLYGVGSRLDQDPALFFQLRKVDIDDLIGQAIKQNTQDLLSKAKQKTPRVIDDTDIGAVFGIVIEEKSLLNKSKSKKQKRNKSDKTAKNPTKKSNTSKSEANQKTTKNTKAQRPVKTTKNEKRYQPKPTELELAQRELEKALKELQLAKQTLVEIKGK